MKLASMGTMILATALLGGCTGIEGDEPGECSDDADNDQDGLFDCDDPDCLGASSCDGDDDDVTGDDDDTTPGDDDDATPGDDDDATPADDDDTGPGDDDDATPADDDDTGPGDDDDATPGDDDDAVGDDDDTGPVDADGDGWDETVDCDDADPAMNLDDVDGDGLSTCDGDCADSNPNIHPYAAEVCDGVDNNCDGAVPADEVDDDGDGWLVCLGDCDDAEPDVNPGHAEVCRDGLDNDCDGTANSCLLSGTFAASSADVYIVGDENHGQAAISVSGAGDVDNDGHPDLIIGAFLVDTGYFTDSGAAYILNGPLSGGIDLGVSAVVLSAETDENWAGYDVSGGRDVDNDGYDDVLVGAPRRTDTYVEAGAAYLVYGPIPGNMNLYSSDAKFMGEGEGDWAGATLDIRGDTNADGHADILMGAPNESSGAHQAGAAYVLYGPQYGDIPLSHADARIGGLAESDFAGSSVAFAGDTNGDGFDDVLVGATGADFPGEDAGAVYLFHGPVGGDMSVSGADAIFTGESAADNAGSSVASAGDTDGDGWDDILIGAYGESTGGSWAGAAYLFVGAQGGSVDLGWADAKLIGEAAGDIVGFSLDSAGDVNGDGLDDLLVGAASEDSVGTDGGAAYLLYSPVSGAFDLSLADVKVTGWGAFDLAGHDVSWCGDLDGDGYDDMFLGSPLADIGGLDAGAAYVFAGEGI